MINFLINCQFFKTQKTKKETRSKSTEKETRSKSTVSYGSYFNYKKFIDEIYNNVKAENMVEKNNAENHPNLRVIAKAKNFKQYDLDGYNANENIMFDKKITDRELDIAISKFLSAHMYSINKKHVFKKIYTKPKQIKIVTDADINFEEINLITRSALVSDFLSELPANVCTPKFFEAVVKYDLSKENLDINVEYLTQAEIKKMPLLSAVGMGSVHKPAVIILSNGNPECILVAKGITYDSGGLNLKFSMQTQMHRDKIGAVVAYSVAKILAQRKCKNFAIALVLAENMPSGSAYRPGDIFVSRTGKSVFIENTDAEGRLAMADGIELLQEKFPNVKSVITLATLTGDALYCLGPDYFAAITNDPKISSFFKKNLSPMYNDQYWFLPFLSQDMSHHLADVTNLKPGFGGISGAAKFLQFFAKKGCKFLYLDIAAAIFRPDIPDPRLLADLIEFMLYNGTPQQTSQKDALSLQQRLDEL